MRIPTPKFDLQSESTLHLRIGLCLFTLLAALFQRMDERVQKILEATKPAKDPKVFSTLHYFSLLSSAGLLRYPLTPLVKELQNRKRLSTSRSRL